MKRKFLSAKLLVFVLLLCALTANAQTTEFPYSDTMSGVTLADGVYTLRFRLYDAPTGGTQIGSQVNIPDTPVTNLSFSVILDFGAAVFSGDDRYIEVSYRDPITNNNVIVSPRRKFLSLPYAIRALDSTDADNSAKLDGVEANQYVQTNDPRLSDARTPTSGSGYYLQNGTNPQSANFNITGNGALNGLTANSLSVNGGAQIGGALTVGGTLNAGAIVGNLPAGDGDYIQNRSTQQTLANFNISGSGTLNTLNAATVNVSGNTSIAGGLQVGGSSSSNIFNATSQYNIGGYRVLGSTSNGGTFVGKFAGNANPTGISNSFFGASSGATTTLGEKNSFFGQNSGANNVNGSRNSFFGVSAGFSNLGGYDNSYFGFSSGNIANGVSNSFFGSYSGGNSTGGQNTFLGSYAGYADAGNQNVFIGYQAAEFERTGSRNVFIGYRAGSAQSGNSNTFIGENAGSYYGLSNPAYQWQGSNNTLLGANTNVGPDVSYSTAIGAGAVAPYSNMISLGRNQGQDSVFIYGTLQQIGNLELFSVPGGGVTHLCLNYAVVSQCSSSLRYKTNIKPFNFGLNIVNRLQPIIFDWKNGGMTDLGLGAEDVAAVEPLLATYNKDGQVEGVKYDRIGVVLLNAVKEQQAQIEAQARQIQEQQKIIDGLRTALCAQNPTAEVCGK